MAIESISSAGAMSVSSTAKPSRQPEREVQVVNVGTSVSQHKVDSLAPVNSKGRNGNQNQDDKGQDKSGVQSEKEVSPDKVKSAVDDINRQIKQNMRHTQCSFKYHEDTNRISITVRDSDTDEVIREIPPEKALDMLAKAWELAGLMVDEKR